MGSFLSTQIKCLSNRCFFYTRVESPCSQLRCDVFVLSAQMFTCTWLNPLVSSCALPPGLLLMVGLMLYPAGWGSEKVISYCGPEASPFRPALCSLGWAFYAAIGGTLASFLCAVLSAQAEIATSSDKVQEEIEEGKSLICLLWASRNLGKLQEIYGHMDIWSVEKIEALVTFLKLFGMVVWNLLTPNWWYQNKENKCRSPF